MPHTTLNSLLVHHKDYIFLEMKQRLALLSWSPYQDFFIGTDDGVQRLKLWIDLVIEALGGEHQLFYSDQEKVGYCRAIQGFKLENVSKVYYIFRQILWEILEPAANDQNLKQPDLIKSIWELNEILFKGHDIISRSWLKAREEQVCEKVTQLEELYKFTQEIITNFELQGNIDLILKKIKTLFNVDKTYIVLYQSNQLQEIYSYPFENKNRKINLLIEKTLKAKHMLCLGEDGKIYTDLSRPNMKRIVSVPIQVHGTCYGVLALCSDCSGFKFTDKELSFLYQFVHIMAVVLENVLMFKEIEQSRKELRLFNTKIITIQEEERKRLATDIHDTLVQTLTGISYKIQFCKKLSENEPELLPYQLNELLKTVRQAIEQSRSLISSLHPDLIDTMGLIPALKDYIKNFESETGITITTEFQEIEVLSSKIAICIFRVSQEALMNIYKHAHTKIAKIILKEDKGIIFFIVIDYGKGFDTSKGPPWAKDSKKFGLLSMKERVESIGGSLFFKAKKNKGLRIEAEIPVDTLRKIDGED